MSTTLRFPTSEQVQIGSITWAPPSENWNCWRAANIDEKPLAFQTLDQISADLLAEEQGRQLSPHLTKIRQSLPVFQYRQNILEAVANNPVVLIKGATGCGKSTQANNN